MKKRMLIIVSVIIILFLGVVIWNHAQASTKKLAGIHDLHHILTFAEEKGADYTADRLDYLIVYSYTKDDLLQKWGTPNESITDTDADVWL